MSITSKKFRDTRTGEIVTQFPILDIKYFVEVTDHHYFANHAMGWVTADTEEAAIEKLLLTNTDPSWNRNCLKDGVFLTLFVCRVPLPDDAPYKIEWYVPQVEGLTECKNMIVTYLTKTKYKAIRDPADEIKKLKRKLAKFAGSALDGEELNTVLAALRTYQEKGYGDPFNRPDRIQEIAAPTIDDTSLDNDGIDRLCERLNCS